MRSPAPSQEHGLGITCSLGLSFDNDINSSDPDSVARGERLLNDALAAARDLGSPYLGGVIFSALGPYPDMPTDAGRRNSVGVIRRLAERAAASDITLGLECVNRYETNLLNTAAQAMEYIERGGRTKRGGAPRLVPHEHRGGELPRSGGGVR